MWSGMKPVNSISKFTRRNVRLGLLAAGLLAMTFQASLSTWGQVPDVVSHPYVLDTGLVSRSISFENPTGAPGEGGKAASHLGPGRKGAPARTIQPGEEVQLCDIEGPGTIRHIWMTTARDPRTQRACILRAWWDGQEYPSIECPIGDFFGFAHGKIMPYHSAVHSVGPTGGRNIWIPMPFTKRARITFRNDGEKPVPLYYQITYTLGDNHPQDVGRLHVLFRRENPTTMKKDFELLPRRNQKGRFLGTVIGVRNLHPERWWGEGELKVYMDGDEEWPTICGTGSEDYVGLAWGIQQTPFFYNGCSLAQKNFVSMYRWHLVDPIMWRHHARITIQQIAWEKDKGLVETEDDWCCATFWYEPIPSEPLPPLPSVEERCKDIWED